VADDIRDDEHEDEASQREDANLKRLREQAADAAAAKRELVFVKAGVDTDSRLGKLALAGYDGELTVEAVKTFATEIGAIGAPPPAPAVTITDDERALANDRQALAGGRAEPAQDQGEHPTLAALKDFQARLERGSGRDNARAVALDKILTAAANGDQRVIYSDRELWKQQVAEGL
jgi:hypothetical protein